MLASRIKSSVKGRSTWFSLHSSYRTWSISGRTQTFRAGSCGWRAYIGAIVTLVKLFVSGDWRRRAAGFAPRATLIPYRDCKGLMVPVVGSSDMLGQLQARAIFSLISDTPASWKLASLLFPSALRALMNTLPLSGRARMKSTGCGEKAARPSIDDRHTSFTGSCKSIRKRTVTDSIAQISVSGREGRFRLLFSASQNKRCITHGHPGAELRAVVGWRVCFR